MKRPFGAFRPDLAPYLNEGLTGISNAYPRPNGYAPVGSLIPARTALPFDPVGAASFVSPKGRAAVLAGSLTTLYRASSGGWQELKTGYSGQGDARWRFVQFGGLAIATNGVDPLQKIDIETGEVADLDGSPPVSPILGIVGDFLVEAVVDGDVNKAQWSGINNAGFWTVGARQSDFQIMADGGAINGIVGGEYGLILQRNCVRRMSYVGGNTIFRFDKIKSNIGCVTVHSVAQHGERAFWLSDSGFVMWNEGQLVPIGFEKVDRTFAAAYGVSSYARMSSAIDGPANTVFWSMSDRIWAYNWLLEQWTIIDVPARVVFAGVTPSITLDEQDPVYGSLDDLVDGAGLPGFDDPRFKGGDPLLYLFDANNVLGTLAGDNMAASFTTGDIEMAERTDTRLRKVRLLSDVVAGVTLTILGRQRLGDVGTSRNFASLRASGEMPVRIRGRYLRMTKAIAAGQPWTFAQGLDVEGALGGKR